MESAQTKAHLNTRSRLLQAATACFARGGYEGTSLREIAEAADVAQQLITYHFGSKEQLWIAVVHSLHDEFMRTMSQLRFNASEDFAAQFRAHQKRVFRDRLRSPFLAQIWTQEYLSSPERFERILQPILEDFGEEVSSPYFQNAAEAGVGDGFSAAETGLICHALLQLSILNPFFVERTVGTRVDSDAGIDALIDLLCRILSRTKPAAEHAQWEDDPTSAAPAATDQQTRELKELKLALADLTLENRRLKASLAAKP